MPNKKYNLLPETIKVINKNVTLAPVKKNLENTPGIKKIRSTILNARMARHY